MSIEISGFTIARNVSKLNYPIRQCVSALARIANEVVIAYDPTSEDDTQAICEKIQKDFSANNIVLVPSVWDLSKTDQGREIGRQTEIAKNACSSEWVLYCQLDEGFHEDTRNLMMDLVDNASVDVTGFRFIRPYFFKNLQTIRTDWTIPVTRLVRKEAFTFATLDGHTCEPLSEGTVRDVPNAWLFHYSRVGEAAEISRRVRNLDTFFHAEETLIPEQDLPDYDFVAREFDNFSTVDIPAEVEGKFAEYTGTHPNGFGTLYSKGSSYMGKSAPHSHYY